MMFPDLPPLPPVHFSSSDASTPATTILECHPEFTGAGSGAVNSGSSGNAQQTQFPAALINVSGESSAGGCAAVNNVHVGGSPQQQPITGIPRNVFGEFSTSPAPAGPPPGRQDGQLISRDTQDVIIR
jgi:hypothetical protein